jgi:hypothetical protein
MVAHGEEYIYMYFHHDHDRALALKAAQFTRSAGAYVIPNLSAYEVISLQWGKPEQAKAFLARPEAIFLNPCRRQSWANDDYVLCSGTLDGNLQFLRIFTKTLSDTGVPLMLGADSPNIPGMFADTRSTTTWEIWSNPVLTPYEALSAGTRIPGQFIEKFLPGAESFGRISIGARADLLLLKNNPLDSVSAVREPMAVMAAGHWMPSAFLRALLDRYANQYHSAPCHK